MLRELSADMKNPLIFTVTSNTIATDALELFEQQLNPWNGADPSRAELLKFIDSLYEISEVLQITIVIWDGMSPSAQFMKRHEMDQDQFRSWIVNYYRTELADPAHGAQGIFYVRANQRPSRKHPRQAPTI